MARMTFQQACVDAIATTMRIDNDVFIMGEDIGPFGGPLRSTAGLWEEFGEGGRVIDMPISEGTIVGAAVGAAMQGKRPIVDLMFLEFLGLTMQQFLDAGAMHYYSNGAVKIPLVVRAKYGIGPFPGHAYDFHSWLVNTPGVKVVAPSTPTAAYGLMLAAIRDNNPVLFLEHMGLYHAGREEIDLDAVKGMSLGKAAIRQEGTDVTIVASAMMVKRALKAANELEEQGISVEVVDLQTIVPMDEEVILESAQKTGRLVVATESIKTGNSGNDVVALVASERFDAMKAPIKCVSPPPIPVPFHRHLEKAYLPEADAIADAARSIMA